MFEQFIIGTQLMLTPYNIMFACFGIVAGIFIGAIPGLTVTMALALLIPMTFNMDPIPSIAMLLENRGITNANIDIYSGDRSAADHICGSNIQLTDPASQPYQRFVGQHRY